MRKVSSEEQGTTTVPDVAPLFRTNPDLAGTQIVGKDGLPITIGVENTNTEITPAGIEVENLDIGPTSGAAVEEAIEVETDDVSVLAGTVGIESVPFNVE